MTTQTAPQYAAAPSRPLGVAILAVLVGIFGFLLILGGVLILAGIGAAAYLGIPTGFVGIGGVVVGIVVLVIGLIVLGLALGLWHLRMWALVLTILFVLFELVSFGLAGHFVTFGFIFALILFIYLIAVRHHFE